MFELRNLVYLVQQYILKSCFGNTRGAQFLFASAFYMAVSWCLQFLGLVVVRTRRLRRIELFAHSACLLAAKKQLLKKAS